MASLAQPTSCADQPDRQKVSIKCPRRKSLRPNTLRRRFCPSIRLNGHPIGRGPFNLTTFNIATCARGSRPFLAPRLLALYSASNLAPAERNGPRPMRRSPTLGKNICRKYWSWAVTLTRSASEEKCRTVCPRLRFGLVWADSSLGRKPVLRGFTSRQHAARRAPVRRRERRGTAGLRPRCEARPTGRPSALPRAIGPATRPVVGRSGTAAG